jgi:hypothetical protein
MSALTQFRWSELSHAYGLAGDLQRHLEELFRYPTENDSQSELWHTLWSSLCHQGDVYSASYAAVPVIIEAVEAAPLRVTRSYFQLPVCIELARLSHKAEVPDELAERYFRALSKLPFLVAKASDRPWDSDFATVAAAAVALAKGNAAAAQLLVEVERQDIPEVLEWYSNR